MSRKIQDVRIPFSNDRVLWLQTSWAGMATTFSIESHVVNASMNLTNDDLMEIGQAMVRHAEMLRLV